MPYGSLLVISGPSGSGKSTLLKYAMRKINNIYFSISATTRKKRDSEVEGRDYYFIDKSTFDNYIQEDKIIEWAKVHDNYYATLKSDVKKALREGKLVVFDIDVAGHQSIRKYFKHIITSVFILPPSKDILKNRLISRGSNSKANIQTRLKNIQQEIPHICEYDFLIINDDKEVACKEFLDIVKSAILKRNFYNIKDIISKWQYA